MSYREEARLRQAAIDKEAQLARAVTEFRARYPVTDFRYHANVPLKLCAVPAEIAPVLAELMPSPPPDTGEEWFVVEGPDRGLYAYQVHRQYLRPSEARSWRERRTHERSAREAVARLQREGRQGYLFEFNQVDGMHDEAWIRRLRLWWLDGAWQSETPGSEVTVLMRWPTTSTGGSGTVGLPKHGCQAAFDSGSAPGHASVPQRNGARRPTASMALLLYIPALAGP